MERFKRILKDKRVLMAIAAAIIAAIQIYSPELADVLRPLFELLIGQ